MQTVPFETLDGWAADDHAAALRAFRRTARRHLDTPYRGRQCGGAEWAERFARAARTGLTPGAEADPRAFFERCFEAHRVRRDGFVTGFFEPCLPARAEAGGRFCHPLHGVPPDLVKLDDNAPRRHLDDPQARFARRLPDGRLVDHPDRAAIAAGALHPDTPVLAWLADPVDLFFVHVQGAARLDMGDGTMRRVSFAAKSGHPYTSLARTLCDAEGIDPAQMTADRLAERMRAMDEASLRALLAHNRSYIFFRTVADADGDGKDTGGEATGQTAAAGVPLTPLRSLAVDRTLHGFGTPVFLQVPRWPGASEPMRRLMVAQDTGSAIIGPARGDVFTGSGNKAGLLAGRVRHPATFTVFLPRAVVS